MTIQRGSRRPLGWWDWGSVLGGGAGSASSRDGFGAPHSILAGRTGEQQQA